MFGVTKNKANEKGIVRENWIKGKNETRRYEMKPVLWFILKIQYPLLKMGMTLTLLEPGRERHGDKFYSSQCGQG